MSKTENLYAATLASNPRATLPSWLRFAHYIENAIDAFPKPFTFKPTGLQPSTFCTRARDAVRGCLAFQYPSRHEHSRIVEWFDAVAFTYDTDSVTIAEPLRKGQMRPVAGETIGATKSLTFSTLSVEELLAFLLLLSHQRLEGPLILLQPDEEHKTLKYPNTVFTLRPDGSLLIL